MSRIGNAPISIPEGVELKIEGNTIQVKGPKGELSQEIGENMECSLEDGTFTLKRKNEEKETKAKHGLYRALINNMVVGVTDGYKTEQELVGVGYRAQSSGQKLQLTLGFSHNVVLELPDEIKVSTQSEKGKNPVVILESADKQLVGQVAAKIRSLRKPEPYKGKGIRFVGEHIRRKAGKAAG